MTYLALARKWRPQSFAQLVGQEAISKAMIKSLDQGRLHHAYLFAGTRGVGKTSIARLIAKALNCEQGVSSTPCLSCESCLAIEQGRFVDLIEIDAASRTRVEDTRSLLDNVQYAPTSGRYKIYLIDEVHMLSMHSFNALLKTLEEPPEHVKFLLATTDPQKLPITVLSRCLQFNLKALDIEPISKQLEKILGSESLAFEATALQLLAKAARGSMRDALSLLDQAIASMDAELKLYDVKAMLGYTQRNFALEILQALVGTDAVQLVALCREIGKEGGQFTYVLSTILENLHELAIIQMLGTSSQPLLMLDPELGLLAQHIKPEDLQLFYQIALKGLNDLALAPNLTIGFEMTILRMYTFKPASTNSLPTMAWQTNSLATTASNLSAGGSDNTPILAPTIKPPDVGHKPQDAVEEKPNFPVSDWPTIIHNLQLSGLALNAMENSELIEKIENIIHLKVTKGHQALFTKTTLHRIEEALQQYYKETVQLKLTVDSNVKATPAKLKQEKQAANQADAQTTLQDDPVFNQISQKFSAELVKNSIEILKDPL